jgi:hypothetical protein
MAPRVVNCEKMKAVVCARGIGFVDVTMFSFSQNSVAEQTV